MDWPSGWSDGAVAAATWTQAITDALGWGMLAALLFLAPLVVLFCRVIRRRRFWCAHNRREVEVEFVERGLPGFRHAVSVRSCSVFDPPTAVECRRGCLDADVRRQPWAPAVPITRRGAD